ncbi:MAG: hypothetical protein EBU63_03195 [Alphaproteobacteria bacterium]|nr:hypothetical protein [Alphaproteobacteria bacterium]
MTQQHNHQLSFTSPVLLFGAAPVMPSTLDCAKQMAGWPVLAADGGLENARKYGLLPQAVIGDMDSAHDLDQLPAAVQRITLSGQDDTDFEKSLRIISAPLIVGIGFLDGRFDHALAALDTLARLPDDQPILLVGNHDVCCQSGRLVASIFWPRLGLNGRLMIFIWRLARGPAPQTE